MKAFTVTILCDHGTHGRPRSIETFDYAQHGDTGEWQWFWAASRKTGGGKRDAFTGLGEWMEPKPSHATVREDFDDGIARVRLRCKGHADVGMPWGDFITRYLEPCRANDVRTVQVRLIVSSRTNATRRRDPEVGHA